MKVTIFLCIFAGLALLAEAFERETPMKAASRRKPKIVGGMEVKPHSIPFQVGIFLRGSVFKGSFCGGSLITKRYVLTVAHCAVSMSNESIVILGAHKILEKEPQQFVVPVKKTTVHSGYSSATLEHDIAVIELPQQAPLNEYIQLVKLTPPDAGLYAGVTARISGWGFTYDGAGIISPLLLAVESTILTNEECKVKFHDNFEIFDTVVCLDGANGKSACNGDSGGPLVVKANNSYVQIGVVSYGSSAGCEKGFPSAYTRLTSYIDWIKNNTDLH